jgi:hypothetical protein
MACNCQQTKQIAQQKTQSSQSKSGATISSSTRTRSRPAFVSIRYSGPTSAVATGPVTGRQYRFPQSGTILQVDPRDQAALAKVPHLRRI